VAIAWRRLPFYGLRLIHSVAQEPGLSLAVINVGNSASQDAAVANLGRPLLSIGANDRCSWKDLGVMVPEVFFFSGWNCPVLNSLALEVKSSGGKTVCMLDNNRKRNLRQLAGKLVFRYRIANTIDRFFTPGVEGRRLLEYYGVKKQHIWHRLYGADPQIYHPGGDLATRPRDFLFVGQFIRRKGLGALISAVEDLRRRSVDHSILCVGEGPLGQGLEDAGIPTMPFAPPPTVATLMAESKFLVLPSLEEHWGVVVHEAVLCGCALILSDRVGSGADLLVSSNGLKCAAGDWRSLSSCMLRALSMPESWFSACRAEDAALGPLFGPSQWARQFHGLVHELCGN